MATTRSEPTLPPAPAGPVRLGTRGSALALAQTNLVLAQLERAAPSVAYAVEVVHSLGDRARDKPLAALNAQGIFTQALEQVLREGTVEAAVHSAKDLPSTLPPDMLIVAPVRADPWDCLVSQAGWDLTALPPDARVGTGSPRRAAQLLRLRPDLHFEPIRGNVDTRRRAVLEGRLDAVILAAAGLARLGLLDRHAVPLSLDECLPQAGQGTLAVEALARNSRVVDLLKLIDHPPTAACLVAERAVLAHLQAGCQAPIAAHAGLQADGILLLRGRVAALDGGTILEAARTGPAGEAERLGRAVADDLRAQGADALLRETRRDEL